MRRTTLRRAAAAVAAVALALVGVVITAAPAQAATFTVTTTNDAGAGSLRQAIIDANGDTALDDIDFNLPGAAPWTINLATDLPQIVGRVRIDGPGSASLTVNAQNSVFDFGALANVSFVDGITLDTLNVTTASGITSTGASLTLTDVLADGFPEFGVVTDSTLEATDSSFSDNGDGGVFFAPAVAGQALTLTRVDTNNNFNGVFVTTADATGTLRFDHLEATLNDNYGIEISSFASNVDLVDSQVHHNGSGVSVQSVDGGGLDVLRSNVSDNDSTGYVVDLNNAHVSFVDTLTSRNGLVSAVIGGGAYFELNDTGATFDNAEFNGNNAAIGGGLAFQTVHTDDVAAAYQLALHREVTGAFNIATDPVLDMAKIGEVLGVPVRRMPVRAARSALAAAWAAHLVPAEPGLFDLLRLAPLMSTRRAREELGWEPQHDAVEAFQALLAGIETGEGAPTPPLSPDTSGPLRRHEMGTGVGEEP